MKTLTKIMAFTMLFAMVSVLAVAQDNQPKREFRLGVESSNLKLNSGQTSNLEVNIYRSKSFQNKDITMVANNLPKGLSVEFDEQKTKNSKVLLTITADDSLSAGKYTVILQGKTTRVTKGITFSVTVETKGLTKN